MIKPDPPVVKKNITHSLTSFFSSFSIVGYKRQIYKK